MTESWNEWKRHPTRHKTREREKSAREWQRERGIQGRGYSCRHWPCGTNTHPSHKMTMENTLQHTATHYNVLQHAAAHYNTEILVQALAQNETCCHKNRWDTHPILTTEQHTATHHNALQHTATHCNTLQHRLETHLRLDTSQKTISRMVEREVWDGYD